MIIILREVQSSLGIQRQEKRPSKYTKTYFMEEVAFKLSLKTAVNYYFSFSTNYGQYLRL